MLSPARAAAGDEDGPSATPYRPSVSTPAALSAPGWLEIEAGCSATARAPSRGATARRLTFKLAFTPDWGVRVGVFGWVHDRDDAGSATASATRPSSSSGASRSTMRAHSGSSSVSCCRPDTAASAAAAANPTGRSPGSTAPTSAPGTRTSTSSRRASAAPKRERRATGCCSRPDCRARSTIAGASARSCRGRIAAASTTRASLLLSTNYSVSRRLVVDVGAARSLRSGTPVWSATVGFTWLAARVF